MFCVDVVDIVVVLDAEHNCRICCSCSYVCICWCMLYCCIVVVVQL